MLAEGLRDHKNQLAQQLTVAMRPRAQLRLNALLEAHKVAGHDAHDGIAMMHDLIALRGTTGHYEEPIDHDRAMERMRDEFLADNCALRDFTDKVNTFKRDHLPHLTCKMTGATLSTFIIRLMPRVNAAEGSDLIRRLTKDGTMDNLPLVIKECTDIVKDSQSAELRAAAAAVPAANATRATSNPSGALISTIVSATVAALKADPKLAFARPCAAPR